MTSSDVHARLAQFYVSQHDKLWRSLLGYTGDPELASEAEAEALTQALQRTARRDAEPVNDLASWIWLAAYRIAAGLLADQRRQTSTFTVPVDQIMSDDPLIETLSLLDDLAPQQRAIVALRYLADLKPSAIAEILDSTPGSVRVQLHRAHSALRQAWSDQ